MLGAFWGTREGELLGVLVLLAMLSMTTATCVAAARPLVIAAIAAFVGPAALAQLLGPHHLTRLVIASIGFAGIAYAIHHELHRMLVDAIRTRHDNGRLAESLQEHLAERDPSTGLLNRTSFLSATEALAAHRLDDAVIVVEVGNVDGLSAISELRRGRRQRRGRRARTLKLSRALLSRGPSSRASAAASSRRRIFDRAGTRRTRPCARSSTGSPPGPSASTTSCCRSACTTPTSRPRPTRRRPESSSPTRSAPSIARAHRRRLARRDPAADPAG